MLNIITQNSSLKIQYIFIGFSKKYKIITKINDISCETTYLLFIDNFLAPIKGFQKRLKQLMNENIDFCYLSKCKKIYLVKYSSTCIDTITNTININNFNKNNNKFEVLFDSFDINHIDNIVVPEQLTLEYISLLNNYVKSYSLIFSSIYSYNVYNLFLKNQVKKNICYNFIIFIKSIEDLNYLLLLKKLNHRFYRFSIFHNLKLVDEIKSLEAYCKINNSMLFYVKNNWSNWVNFPMIWFEKNVLVDNIKLINNDIFTELNKYHDIKSNVLFDNIISISSSHLILIPYFSNKSQIKLNPINIFNLCKKYIINNSLSNTYVKQINNKYYKKATQLVFVPKINPEIVQQNLLKIRNYPLVIESINDQIKSNYDAKQVIRLLSKKVSISVLCKNNNDLINDANIIINSINDLDYLSDLFLLFSNLQNQQLMNKLCVKVLKLSNENKINKVTLLCFKKLLNQTLDLETLNVVLDFINLIKDKEQFTNKKEIKLVLMSLFLSVGKYVENKEVIDKFNKLILDTFNEDDITNIDKLLNIEQIDNKICLLHFLVVLTTSFSAYYDTYNEFLTKREEIKKNLVNLLSKNLPECQLDQIILLPVSNFYLSYQGIPSADIFKLKSELMRKICPSLNYIRPNLNCPNNKIRICFHSNFLTRFHSVYKDRHQIIKHMSLDDRFQVYFSTYDDLSEDVKYSFGNAKHIKISEQLSLAKNDIEKLNLDVLVYCEISMDPKAYYLAHMRLAKVQINTWGHSDSCGINTIDYFFSSKLYELPYEESQTHYSEKLVLLNSLCTSYNNPIQRYNINLFKSRYEFGFTDEVTIYFCAQSLFKFNPLFDDYIIEILQNNQKSVLVILNNESKTQVLKRFNNKNITSRIHIFPMSAHNIYMNLMYISDIILDPYPFGGCNSSLEAFSMDKIVITHESNMINGRFTAGFYKKMGLDELICKNKNEYVEKATTLTVPSNNNKYIEQIKKNKLQLFNDQESINEWKEKIMSLVRL
jgi:predicted O-linked N-acetylglucosamine transferase (SPINDLY family)